jgi:hypothetical protein
MDKILKSLYSIKTEFIICGDYLTDNYRKNQLNSLLNSYNLFSTVDFPTRIQNKSRSAIDNIFIYYSRLGTFSLAPICNGISDHDAQLILIHDMDLPFLPNCLVNTRKIDKCSLADSNYNLSFEAWKGVFDEKDINVMFSFFLNTYLRLFYTSFPKSSKKPRVAKNKEWITPSIKTKCCFKRDLYLISRKSKDPIIKNFYKTYCKLLSRSIIETKRSYYDKQISNSNNKIKSMWNIVKAITGRKSDYDVIPILSSHDKSSISPKIISDSFNKYYLSVADNIINKTFNNYNSTDRSTNHIEYLSDIYKTTFPTIKYNYASTKGIENIIKNLKTSNSYGYYEIPVKILKNCSYFIISPLTYIISSSLTTDIFPNRLSFSEIKPIYKKGDKNSNYRPISLLTSF